MFLYLVLDLILKDVTDPVIRENFYRIQRYIADNALLGADFKFYETDITSASDEFQINHGLGFTPTDIIPMSADGDLNYFFRQDLSDQTNIYVNAHGPVRLRFLAGRFNQTGRRQLTDSQLQYVAPIISSGSSSGNSSQAMSAVYPLQLNSNNSQISVIQTAITDGGNF